MEASGEVKAVCPVCENTGAVVPAGAAARRSKQTDIFKNFIMFDFKKRLFWGVDNKYFYFQSSIESFGEAPGEASGLTPESFCS